MSSSCSVVMSSFFVWAELEGSCKVRVRGQREAQNSSIRSRVKTKVIGTLVPDHLGV